LLPHSRTFGIPGFLKDFPGGFRVSDGLQAVSQLVERQARVPQSAPFSVPVTNLTRDP
jgi:hypothetical protein